MDEIKKLDFRPLWAGGPVLSEGAGAYPLSTDSVLLADFARVSGKRRVFDLGCGSGALLVLLHAKTPGMSCGGADILPDAAELCRRNLAENGHDASGILCVDAAEHRAVFPHGQFDLVVSNPPYFSGVPVSPDAARATARSGGAETLGVFCAAAAFLLKTGGLFALVHRPERLSELFAAMSANKIEPKRLRMVHKNSFSAPSLVLVEGRRGGKPGLDVEPPLLIETDGAPSAEYRRIYHMEEQS